MVCRIFSESIWTRQIICEDRCINRRRMHARRNIISRAHNPFINFVPQFILYDQSNECSYLCKTAVCATKKNTYIHHFLKFANVFV